MDSSIANNPLAKHFRQPAIYLKLPSGGRFYPEGTLDIGATGEIPVYPMTVKDELMLKTPDALMNGSSICNMIESCCPSIKDAWSIPLIDIDPILIAIRLASYGVGMDTSSKCTHCGEPNDHTIDLRKVLDSLKPADNFNQKNFLHGMVFDIQPQTFKEINTASMINFEQQKIMGVLRDEALSMDQKKEIFQESFAKLTDLNITTLVNCIKSITIEDSTVVVEKELIKDFLMHCDRKTYEDIRDLATGIIKANALDPVSVTCDSCSQPYEMALEFNQSTFFE